MFGNTLAKVWVFFCCYKVGWGWVNLSSFCYSSILFLVRTLKGYLVVFYEMGSLNQKCS